MLTKVKKGRSQRAGGRYAIVASKYNARYVDCMVRAAQKVLSAAGAEAVRVVRVPGAYEIPLAAAQLAKKGEAPFSAIICLGVILRGETQHAQLIGEAVTSALMQIQVQYGVPVIHEVLLLEDRQQAEVRCRSAEHNRGKEAAQTAVEMGRIMKGMTELNDQ